MKRACLFLVFAGLVGAEEIEVIHVLPGSHLDIGFTDTPEAVRAKRVRVLDDAIACATADPSFRWFEESCWVLDAWRAHHRGNEDRLAELKTLLASGQISFGAAWGNPHASMFPESLGLLTFHLDDFEREFGFRPVAAVLNDPPSYPEALVDALAARRVRFLFVGANMAFTDPLPARLSRTPFWWESASGNRVLTWIDDEAYTAAYMEWGIDPDTARFFNPKVFAPGEGALATMEFGVRRKLSERKWPVNRVLVEHAFDNWETGGAKKLPGFVKEWNDAQKAPRIELGGLEVFFSELEKRYGPELPVHRGEWGGQWDVIRAANPVWTWRLREAMKRLPADAPWERRADLATAMEHSQGLGPGWGGMFTEEQTRQHAKEIAALFARAAGPELAEATPPSEELPTGEEGGWKEFLGASGPRVRAGRTWLGPFVMEPAAEVKAGLVTAADGNRKLVRFRLNREELPGAKATDVSAVIEIPLRRRGRPLRLAPESSPSAREGKWLRGEPAKMVVAPEGLRVQGLDRELRVSSPLVFTWTLVEDKKDREIVWLQGLVVRQSTNCELKDKVLKTLPFADLYPGEPKTIEVTVMIEVMP